jgi:uridine kinase
MAQQSTGKMIVGIEGYSGTGKSTLLKALVARDANILAVHRDDFLIDRDQWKQILEQSADKPKTMEYQSVDVDKMVRFANHYIAADTKYTCLLRGDESRGSISGKVDTEYAFDFSKSIMVIEGVWLYHPKLFDEIFDYRMYLDVDQDQANERRRKREMAKWGKDYFPDTHPDSYFNMFKIAYNDYLNKYHPRDRADLLIHVD